MNYLFLVLAVALHGGSVGTAFQPLSPSRQSGCPAETAQGLRVMELFTNTDRYTSFKSQHRLRASDRIRGVQDAAACQRLRALLTTQPHEPGASLTPAGMEFYEDANYYYAVLPAPGSRCTPSRDHGCLATRWQAVQVFDREFTFIAGGAV
ncbi:MAG TPA: hypothetical protein VF584_25125 [Longimicrobium sp.]|jgi:hypothetical protein